MAQTESNNTEIVFCVLGRIPVFTFDMNMKPYIFAHSGVISLVHLFVCMYISYKAHNRCSICDLSQFVTKTVPRQIQSNNIKMCSVYLGEYPSAGLTGI